MISINHTNQEKREKFNSLWGSLTSAKNLIWSKITQNQWWPSWICTSNWKRIYHAHTHVSCKKVLFWSWRLYLGTHGKSQSLWIAFLPFYMDAYIESLLLVSNYFFDSNIALNLNIDFDYIVTLSQSCLWFKLC